uniref:SAM domain-containing protein n=1 Tax=Oryza glumipatula TaxID=40148 RepID=A0A0E0ACI3_9ORYZ
MDWYAWLAKTGLAPALAYEYGRLFNQNELERGDAAHFDHDLLKSMGIAVAKHRLEILKLAKKDSSSAADAGGGDSSSSSYAQLIARKAGRCIARCARRLARPRGVGGGRGSSVTVVPRICSGDDAVRVGAVQAAAAAAATRRRRSVKKMVLMITDGGATAARGGVGFAAGRFSGSQKASLMFHDCYEEEEEDDDDHEEEARCGDGAEGGDEDTEEERCSDGGGGGADVEIKWDSMFQDLKPT